MRKSFLISFVLFIYGATIALAWLSSRGDSSEVVFAQGPYPNGCYTVGTNQAECPDCGGFVTQAQTWNSPGRNAIDVRDTVCDLVNDPPGSCTYYLNPVSIPNPLCPTPTPTPTPTPRPPRPPGCSFPYTITGEAFKEGDSADICSPCNPSQSELDACWQSGGTYDYVSCFCGQSPILLDVAGNGFALTDAEHGVAFDINANAVPDRMAWTAASSDDAFLALDRNNNGAIDDGKELFGNAADQPEPPAGEVRNGFLALAEFDKPGAGGNGDGKITRADAVFAALRLWQDANHNGVSEPGELKSLTALGLARLDLDYKESRRRDEFGNSFRFRAKVRDAQNAQFGRWAWDVYLGTMRQPN